MSNLALFLIPTLVVVVVFFLFWLVVPKLPGFEAKGRTAFLAMFFAVAQVILASMAVFAAYVVMWFAGWMAASGGGTATVAAMTAVAAVAMVALFFFTAALVFAFKNERTYLLRNKFAPFLASFIILAVEGGVGLGLAMLLSENLRKGILY